MKFKRVLFRSDSCSGSPPNMSTMPTVTARSTPTSSSRRDMRPDPRRQHPEFLVSPCVARHSREEVTVQARDERAQVRLPFCVHHRLADVFGRRLGEVKLDHSSRVEVQQKGEESMRERFPVSPSDRKVGGPIKVSTLVFHRSTP